VAFAVRVVLIEDDGPATRRSFFDMPLHRFALSR
jgi:hypothetical protein